MLSIIVSTPLRRFKTNRLYLFHDFLFIILLYQLFLTLLPFNYSKNLPWPSWQFFQFLMWMIIFSVLFLHNCFLMSSLFYFAIISQLFHEPSMAILATLLVLNANEFIFSLLSYLIILLCPLFLILLLSHNNSFFFFIIILYYYFVMSSLDNYTIFELFQKSSLAILAILSVLNEVD